MIPNNYAVIKDTAVENIIAVENFTTEFETNFLQESGADALVSVPEEDAWYVTLGATYSGGKFIPNENLSPYPSWTWNADEKTWDPPTPRPEFDGISFYEWNENLLEWVVDKIIEDGIVKDVN